PTTATVAAPTPSASNSTGWRWWTRPSAAALPATGSRPSARVSARRLRAMARAADPVQARAAATEIVARLRSAGHVAYFAGGCVRDELLGLHPTDYDVATDAPPQRIRELFPRTAEVGAAFGVMLVHLHGCSVEVATFRSEGAYSDARRPDVVHFSDPPTDAARRDFTINALFLDPLASKDSATVEGHVVDYVG